MLEVLVPLIVLMIIGALVAIETTNLLYSVISVGAVGFLLSIVFLFLSAPDLAITQIAVEVITLAVLLKATMRDEKEAVADQRKPLGTVVSVAMILALSFFGAHVLAGFPEFGQPVTERFADAPSNTYLREGLEQTGAPNIVTAVLLDFRGYDTLGEAAVLFCAVTGALSILRRNARQQPGQPEEEGES